MDKELEKIALELKSAADAVKAQGEKAELEMKKLGDLSAETKKACDDSLIKHNEIAARMTEIEQKLVRQAEGPKPRLSLGDMVTSSDEFKSFIKTGGKGKFALDVKALLSALTTDADGSAGDLIVPQRQPGIVASPERRMTIRDLITPGRTGSNAIQYVKETGFVNNAGTVSETAGTTKGESTMRFDLVTSPVATIAHFIFAMKQILDDVPMLASYIDGRLRYGLALKEESQLLNGGGTGADLNGIYTQATAYVTPIIPSAAGNLTKVDIIRLAMLQAVLAEYPANGIVLNPMDWADIELTKTSDNAYLFANPQNGTDPRLWRLPVVETQAMTVDKFLTGAFQMGAQLFDRQDATVEIAYEDGTNFQKNMVTIRAEERLAMAVYRPEAFVKGGFTEALAA